MSSDMQMRCHPSNAAEPSAPLSSAPQKGALDGAGARLYASRVVIRVLVFILALAACTRVETDALPNVRLGMAPRDVRDRFEPGGEGTWQTSVGSGADDTAIEWKAADGSARVKDARFEFHLGMLVAIRATTREPAAEAERITSTPGSVTLRKRAPEGGTSIAVLARDCPTHKEEADRLAARASKK